jgi:hypothetical protein
MIPEAYMIGFCCRMLSVDARIRESFALSIGNNQADNSENDAELSDKRAKRRE